MVDEKTRLWASVVVVGFAILAITVMLIAGVPVETIGTAFLAIGTLASLYLVTEVRQVKQNTNGTLETMRDQLAAKDRQYAALAAEYAEYAKRSVPVKDMTASAVSVKSEV